MKTLNFKLTLPSLECHEIKLLRGSKLNLYILKCSDSLRLFSIIFKHTLLIKGDFWGIFLYFSLRTFWVDKIKNINLISKSRQEHFSIIPSFVNRRLRGSEKKIKKIYLLKSTYKEMLSFQTDHRMLPLEKGKSAALANHLFKYTWCFRWEAVGEL